MNGDPVLRAGMAETFKKQATAADLSGHGLGRCLGQLGRELQLGQVHDTAAPGANKVGMGGGVGIKALQILHNPDGNDPALPLTRWPEKDPGFEASAGCKPIPRWGVYLCCKCRKKSLRVFYCIFYSAP